MIINKARILLIIVTFAVLLNASTTSSTNLKKVTIQLSWFNQFQFAGYFMAKELGIYERYGLDVEIRPFQFGLDIPGDVSTGKVDFAVGRETLILERANGKNIVALYALFQSSPLVLLSTKESNINTIADFLGKRIMTTIDDASEVSIKSMITSSNVKIEDLNFIKHTHNINDLVNKKTDVISAYVSKTTYNLQQMGVEYNMFAPKDYGFDMYSDLLFTSDQMISNDERTVNAFKQASLEGWKYAYANIHKSVNTILEKYNSQNLTKDELLYEGIELKKLSYLNTQILGHIDENKIKRIYDIYKLLGIAKGSIDFNKFVYDSKEQYLYLTQEEINYLKHKQEITMCINPDRMPFEKYTKEGKYIGLNSEFLELFSKNLKTPIKIVKSSFFEDSLLLFNEKKCDIFTLMSPTQNKKNNMNFTSSYINISLALATNNDIGYIENIEQLKNTKIGILNGDNFAYNLLDKVPNITIVQLQSTKEGLEKVIEKEIFGFVGNIADIGYIFQGNFFGQLKISSKFEETVDFGLGIQPEDKLLLQIFEKTIKNLNLQDKQTILNKYLGIKYKEKFDYSFLWKILFVIAIIFLAFIYRQIILKKSNNQLQEKVNEKTKELQELNKELEYKVEKRTVQLNDSNRKLQNIAYIDHLTGSFNRHYFFATAEQLLKLSQRSKETFSLIVLDIDYFKNINDTYGHIVGDKVLCHLVDVIKNELRESDIFSRFGGEEFIILLPKTNIDNCYNVAEHIRTTVEATHYKNDKVDVPITISLGVGEYKNEKTLQELLEKTDVALYKAKTKGRNNTQISS